MGNFETHCCFFPSFLRSLCSDLLPNKVSWMFNFFSSVSIVHRERLLGHCLLSIHIEPFLLIKNFPVYNPVEKESEMHGKEGRKMNGLF